MPARKGSPAGSRPIPRGPPAIGRLVAGGVFPAEEAPNHVLLNWYEADQGSEGGGESVAAIPPPFVCPGICPLPNGPPRVLCGPSCGEWLPLGIAAHQDGPLYAAKVAILSVGTRTDALDFWDAAH